MVNHNGGAGTSLDPLVWSAGSAPKKRRVAVRGSGILAHPAGIDAEFRKAWLPYFCRSGQRETSFDEFNGESVGWLPHLDEFFLPASTGDMLFEVVKRKGASAGSLDGWGWRELKVLPVAWFDGLARILIRVEGLGVWPDGLLDAYITMFAKVDGDATPLGQRPLTVLPLFIVSGLLLGWFILSHGLRCGFRLVFSVLGVVVVLFRLGLLLRLILRRYYLVLLRVMFIFLLLMLLSLLILLIVAFWIECLVV